MTLFSQAKRVIARFGGVIPFVTAIQDSGGPIYDRTHVYKWLRPVSSAGCSGGVIPPKHWIHIIRAANFHKIPLNQLVVHGDAPVMPDTVTILKQLEDEKTSEELFG